MPQASRSSPLARRGNRDAHERRDPVAALGASCAELCANAHTRCMVSKDQGLLAEVERDVLSGAPVADVLRKCIVISGRAGSSELRDWATAELRGYGTADEAPAYRQVGAPIYADAVTGTHHIAGQRISPSMLPDFAQDDLKETYTFQVGIGRSRL